MAAPRLDVEPAEYMFQSSAERPAEYKRLVQAVLNGLGSGCYRLADGSGKEIYKMVRDKRSLTA